MQQTSLLTNLQRNTSSEKLQGVTGVSLHPSSLPHGTPNCGVGQSTGTSRVSSRAVRSSSQQTSLRKKEPRSSVCTAKTKQHVRYGVLNTYRSVIGTLHATSHLVTPARDASVVHPGLLLMRAVSWLLSAFHFIFLASLLSLNPYSFYLKLKENRHLHYQISKHFKNIRRHLQKRHPLSELKCSAHRTQSTSFSSYYVLGLTKNHHPSKGSPLSQM